MNRVITNVKSHKAMTIYAFLLVCALECSVIYTYFDGLHNMINLLLVIIIGILLCPFVSYAINGFLRSSIICMEVDGSKKYRLFANPLIYIVAMLLIQLPFFGAFYPGICSFDLDKQITQFESGHYITNHPLLHTLYMGGLKYSFTDSNIGFAVSNLIQMLAMDSVVGVSLAMLFKKNKNWIVSLMLLIVYTCNPVYIFMSFSSTKDVFFAVFMYAAIMLIAWFDYDNIHKLKFILFIVASVIMLLLRNNAVYAFVLAFVVILPLYNKNKKKMLYIFLTGCSILALYFVANKGLESYLRADKGSIKEMMSAPAQGMARVYNYSANENEKEVILQYIEEPERYKYYISDPIKEQLPFEVLDSKCKHFLLDSFLVCFRHPIDLLDSFMYTTQGFWDPFHAPYQSSYSFLASDNARGGAVRDGKIPALEEWCLTYLRRSDYIEKCPVLALVIENGLYIWLCLLALAMAIDLNDKKNICIGVFLIVYLGTLFVGPAAFARYALPFYLVGPWWLFDSLSKK